MRRLTRHTASYGAESKPIHALKYLHEHATSMCICLLFPQRFLTTAHNTTHKADILKTCPQTPVTTPTSSSLEITPFDMHHLVTAVNSLSRSVSIIPVSQLLTCLVLNTSDHHSMLIHHSHHPSLPLSLTTGSKPICPPLDCFHGLELRSALLC